MDIGTARALYVRWLSAARDLSPHTIRAYDGDLASFQRHLGSQTDIARIDGESLLSFLEAQKAVGLRAASLRRRASSLRGFSAWLQAQGLLEDDPWRTTRPVIGRSRRLPRALPRHELERLVDFLLFAVGGTAGAPDIERIRERPHEATTLLGVLLMVATGMRVHEMTAIRYQDIDLAGRSVRLLGKGRRERQVYFTNDWIAELVSAYLDARVLLHLQHAQLFFNLNFDPLTPAAMRSRLVQAGRKAGLSTHVTPHMLRHTAATQLIEAGVDIRYIQRLLGHASLSTTEIYTHVSDATLKRAISDADVLGGVMRQR